MSRVIALLFLGPSALDGVGGLAPCPGRLYPREKPGTHCTGGWVGPRVGLEDGKSRPHRDSITDRPARSQSLYRMSYRATTFLNKPYNFGIVR